MNKRLLSLVGLGLLGGVGFTRLPRTDALFRFEERTDPEVAVVRRRLGELAVQLEQSRSEVGRLQQRQRRFGEVAPLLRQLEAELERAQRELDLERARADAEAQMRAQTEARIEERLAEIDDGIETRWTDLQRAVLETHNLAEAASGGLREFKQRELPDRERMWQELMGPTVQLAGDSTVGSGVLLQSREQADGSHVTHLLTAWHVVRDILADADGLERPIPVTIYSPEGDERQDTATLLEFDPALDVALLEMSGDTAYTYGASLPSASRMTSAGVFDPIYAVGCPLGNDPIPTFGEVADTAHEVGDETYWMISAPTYIGNSGGGIFDAETHELLGIFSKIYTHGNLRPTVVPHMGLVTPMDRIYHWLGDVGYGELGPQPGASRPLSAAAGR